ncbi:hypothetical protein DsansV1_C18g0149231 [Dioscorea sansibarensis]
MGDSTMMTVEFLRARLLSERLVSRTARQRADQLTYRVIELEDQLKSIAIQRMKAEKAATEVLAILECQGIDGLSQVTSSSSEHDEGCDKWEENGSTQKRDEVSRVPTVERNVMKDVLSGPEVEGSEASQGRPLSWKSRSDSPNSHRKLRMKQLKSRQTRTSLFSSTESSGKLELGKSCRRIKRRDTRLATETGGEVEKIEEKSEATQPNQSGDRPDKNSGDRVDKRFNVASVLLSPNEGTCLHVDGEDRDDNKGIKLERTDPLIDWYHAEENVQGEWEEKYNARESSSTSFAERSQPAVVEMASKSSGTGKQDRKETYLGYENISSITEPAVHNLPHDQKVHGRIPDKSAPTERTVAVGVCDGFISPDLKPSTFDKHTNTLAGQQHNRPLAGDAGTNSHEFVSPAKGRTAINKTGKRDRAQLDDNSDSSSHGRSHWSTSYENSTVKTYSEIDRQLPKNPSVESVLISLCRAKISLQHHINVSPSRGEGVLAKTTPTYSQNQVENLDIPIGMAELFRLPTDSFPEDDISRPKLCGSGLSLASAHTDVLHAVSTNGYQQPLIVNAEAGHRPSLGQKYDDSYFTYTSNRCSLAPYLTTDAAPFRNGFTRAYTDARNEMPARGQHLYDGETFWFDQRRL